MSAFMHDNAHVDAIIHGAMTYGRTQGIYFGNPTHALTDNPTEAGRVLLRENAESMAYRYNMKDLDNEADGGTRAIEYLGYVEQAEGYEYDASKPHKTYSAGEVLMALHSFEYQACERPEFEQSDAHALIRGIERALIRSWREYSSAETWAICDGAEVTR